MKNEDILKLFRNVAAAYSIKDEKKYRFQIIAYQRAADTIESLTTEVKELVVEDKLETLPGVGPSIRAHLQELIATGSVKHFQTITEDIPPSVFILLDIPSFGPKKAFRLVTEFGLNKPETVVSELEKIAKEGKIASLEGFGEKSQQDILRAIHEYKQGITKSVRMNLPFAGELAEKIVAYIKESKDVLEIHTLGSLRRRRETIGDVDLAVSTTNPKAVIDHFIAYPYKERLIERGETNAGLIVSGGKHIDLMTQTPDRFGALLQHFTGSKNHNVHLREYALKQGLSLSEYGIKNQKTGETELIATEEEFYKRLGMQWVPPEMREDTGEIELALKHKIPKIVELSDIKGDFHLHSSFPIEPSHDMGKSSMEEMIKKALELNYSYIGFSEHNPSMSKHTKEQTYEILKKRSKEIDQLNLKYKNSIRIYSLLEVDILPTGEVAIDDNSAELLDGMLVSIHSVFSMDKKTMTKRVLKGLSHPKAKILTHPTGRLINQRSGYELDWTEIFAFCQANNKALEINAFPTRLDLTDNLVRQAIKKNTKLVIDTDSHQVDQMSLMQYGVSVARRGWATSHDILNTKEYNEIEDWFRE